MNRRRRLFVATLCLGAIPCLATCSSELAPDGPVAVHIVKASIWPDTLSMAEIATLAVSLTRDDGQPVLGVELSWRTSDASVVSVATLAASAAQTDDERLNAPLRAIVTTHDSGTAKITVRLDRPGFEPAELTVPVTVKRRGWPTLLTASDTARGTVVIARADAALLAGATVDWTSNNPTILQVVRSTSDPFSAVLTGISSGIAQVSITVTNAKLGRNVFQVPVTVGAMQVIELPAWQTGLTVSDSSKFAVEVRDASNQRVMSGVPVQWRSTNALAFVVDANGNVKALSQGGGELIATAGAAPFQTSEHRAVIGVGAMQVTETSPWPRILTVSDSASLGVLVRDASGQRPITNVPVQWRSTNALSVSVDGAGKIRALSNGGAEIIATVGEPPYQTSEHRVQITVGNLEVVEATPWPTLLTVTDTIKLSAVVRDAAHVPKAGVRVRWSSTNIVAFTVDTSGTVRAFGQGGGEIVATVGDPPFQTAEHRVTVSVQPLTIAELTPWPAAITLNNDYPLGVVVKDALGRTRTGVRVRWRSTNQSGFSVDSITGVLRGVGLFGGEVIATAGEAPYQTSERRKSISVFQRWIMVDAGRAHTCALTSPEGSAYCWGSNTTGELGIGTVGGSLSQPTRVATVLRFNGIEAGGYTRSIPPDMNNVQTQSHTCGQVGNNLYCWGSTRSAQLGDGTLACNDVVISAFFCPTRPVPVLAIDQAAFAGTNRQIYEFTAAGRHSCGIIGLAGGSRPRSGGLYCWGMKTLQIGPGQFVPAGFGTVYDQLLPLGSFTDYVTDVTGGGAHVCFRLYDATGVPLNQIGLYCAGLNERGQLGSGTNTNTFTDPTPVLNAGNTQVDGWPASAGTAHTCAIVPALSATVLSGQAMCWGSNSAGQLGTGSLSAPDDCNGTPCSLRAINVLLSGGITAIASGHEHTCAIAVGGAAYCWGSNSDGQLGLGTIGGSVPTPTAIGGGLRFSSITTGSLHTCGVTLEGALYCWGRNDEGQLGTSVSGSAIALPARVVNPSP